VLGGITPNLGEMCCFPIYLVPFYTTCMYASMLDPSLLHQFHLIAGDPNPPPSSHLPSKPLPRMPFPLPPRKPWTLLQRPNLPPFLRHPIHLLLPRPLLQRRHRHMLHMPRILIFHQVLLPLPQHLRTQCRYVRFVAEILDGREERLEIEDDGAGKGEAA